MRIRNVRSLLVWSWLVAALAIVGIAFVISPAGADTGFWGRVAWIEFLNLLFWFGNINWFSETTENTDMAITPAVNVIISTYCVLSFLLVIGFYSSEAEFGLSKAHLVIQIVMLAVCALLYLRLQMAAHFADKDLIISADAAVSPLELANEIKNVEDDFSVSVKKDLKTLREKITYSIQNTNKVRTTYEYRKFAADVMDHINRSDFTSSNIKALLKDINTITHQTKQIQR